MASLLKTIATTPEVLALLLFLTVPGFVFVRAFDELHPARRRGSGQLIIDSGFWSCLILAVWFMPALILFELGPRLPYWLYHLLLFVFILLGVFITPLLLAYTITGSEAFISKNDFEQVRGDGQTMSFVLARVEPGESPEAVAARIEDGVSGVTAQSRTAFAEQERKLIGDMASDMLAIMNLAGFVIGLAVVALTVYTATLDRRSEYGVLKAVGARNGHLYGIVLAQALYSVALGIVVALAFTLLLSVVVPYLGPNLSLWVGGASLLKVGILSLVIAGLAAIVSIKQMAGLDPALVLRAR